MTTKLELHVNLMRAILWQYENAPKVKTLAQGVQDWTNENHSAFWQQWFNDVFNLRTANDFGLSVWSRILDVPLTIRREKRTQSLFGFGLESDGKMNFGRGNFGRANTGDYAVTTEQARKILLLRWFQLTSKPTVPNINKALEIVFGAGIAYVQDNLNMTNNLFMFTEMPDYQTIDLLKNTDLLPRGAGVGSEYYVMPEPGFGFGVFHKNFGNGNFSKRRII